MSRMKDKRHQKKKLSKKTVFFCTLLILVVLLIIIQSQGGERTSGPYVYTISRGNATIIDYTGNDTSLVIPASLHDYPVVAIGDHAFERNDALVKIVLPGSLIRIGEQAFYNCDSLRIVTFPENLTKIGKRAFSKCDSLAFLSFPESITSIDSFAFDDNNMLYYVVCHEGAKSIITDALADYPMIQMLFYTVEEDAATITEYRGNGKNLTIFDELGGYTVNAIGEQAFMNSDTLVSVEFPEGLVSIREKAFYGCSSLASVILPESVAYVGENAFGNCESLRSISYAADVANSIENAITDSSTVKLVQREMFSYTIENGEASITGFGYTGRNEQVTIPDTVGGYPVTAIHERAFMNCESIRSIELPQTLQSIEEQAFSGCRSLSAISLPEGLTKIGLQSFMDCDSLVYVILPDSLESLGYKAFESCTSLRYIIHPGTEVAGLLANSGPGIRLLEKGTFSYTLSEGNAVITGYGFASDTVHLTIPDMLDGYPVTEIGDTAFIDGVPLVSITLPDSIVRIGDYAFHDCANLQEIVIPEHILTIGEKAFSDCTSLHAVQVPVNAAIVGNDVFKGCTAAIAYYGAPISEAALSENHVWTLAGLAYRLQSDPSTFIPSNPVDHTCLLVMKNDALTPHNQDTPDARITAANPAQIAQQAAAIKQAIRNATNGALSFTLDPDKASVFIVADMQYSKYNGSIMMDKESVPAYDCEVTLTAIDISTHTQLAKVVIGSYWRSGGLYVVMGGNSPWKYYDGILYQKAPDLETDAMQQFSSDVLIGDAGHQ